MRVFFFVLVLFVHVGVGFRLSRDGKSKVFYELDTLKRGPPTQNMDEILQAPSTIFIPTVAGKSIVIKKEMASPNVQARLFVLDELGTAAVMKDPSQVSTVVYLGRGGEHDYVALEVVVGSALALTILSGSYTSAVSLRTVAERLDLLTLPLGCSEDASSLLALAVAYTTWHSELRWCPRCGSSTTSTRSGSSRKCTSQDCGKSHYPRLEPAVIMLVLSQCHTHVLLGRKKNWLPGRYSCLAGFVETGETLEQTVVRETMEESGIEVSKESVYYFASQPWPFPSSLMLGFSALAASPGLPTPVVDVEELEDARWFSLESVRAALPLYITDEEFKGGSKMPDLHFPGASSMARAMIAAWASE